MPRGVFERTSEQKEKIADSIKSHWETRERKPENRICTICGDVHKHTHKLRCQKCYKYFRFWGTERPATLKVGRKDMPYNFTGKCSNCGKETEKRLVKGRCMYCYNYLNEHGVDRRIEKEKEPK